jgi:hypothetical protein
LYSIHINNANSYRQLFVNFNRILKLFDTIETKHKTKAKSNIYRSMEFYQQFFDVDTDDVMRRLLWSVLPRPNSSKFFKSKIRAKPDLYGPFWICVTLIFAIGISGNVASYLQVIKKLIIPSKLVCISKTGLLSFESSISLLIFEVIDRQLML